VYALLDALDDREVVMMSTGGAGPDASASKKGTSLRALVTPDVLGRSSAGQRNSAPAPGAAEQRATRQDLLLSSVVNAVSRRLRSLSDEDLAQLDPAQIAERAAALIPTPHPFAQLGPFYPTGAVTKWLGITRQALDQRVRARKMLGCPTSDGGQRVYPVWQFTADGRMIPHLAEVLDALHGGIDDPWTWATWLAAPVAGRFDGRPAHQWLAEGRDAEPVLTEARRTATRLAQ
jgi:hypothetical protein